MASTNESVNEGELTLELLDKALVDIWSNHQAPPGIFVMHPRMVERIQYEADTVTLVQQGNYLKRQGPDGRIYCIKKYGTGKIRGNYGTFPRYDESWTPQIILNRHQRKHPEMVLWANEQSE